MVFCGIHLWAISQEVPMGLICNICGDYTFKFIATSPRGQWVKDDASASNMSYNPFILHERNQLDESTARRQLKSPQSLPGRSIHLTLVTKWSWSWMTYCHLLCAMSISPPILRYNYFKIWPWKSMVKVIWVVKGQGQIWPSKFKVKVMAKVKPNGHIWALEFNQYVCFSFRGNRTIFGWDIANSIFDLEKSRSRSRQKSTKI